MATQIVMPKLSPTMEEGQLGKWLKNEGDQVSMGEPLAEIETDKASMEMQALGTGVLRKILIKEGATVPLGQVIAIIGEADEDISALVGQAESGQAGAEDKNKNEEKVEGDVGATTATAAPQTAPPAPAAAAAVTPAASSAPSTGNGQQSAPVAGQQQQQQRQLVSPLAARMAAEAGIKLNTLTGSGPAGRIVKRDIEEAMRTASGAGEPESAPRPDSQPAESREQAPAAAGVVPQTQSTITGASPYRDEPVSEMRRTIARRLTSSIGPVPHFFLTSEIEMDRAVELRHSLNEMSSDVKVSINDLIIKVVAVALRQHPQVNASFQDKVVRYYERSDIGVAVAIEDGLITPIVRSADIKTIGAIAREVREMAERARSKKLKPEEYMGASFSVSNLGMFGIDEFTAVINPPEAAILAVGAVQPKPVVRDNQIVVKQMMRVTMSCDHRVIDGASGAKFLQTFKQIMENPLHMLI